MNNSPELWDKLIKAAPKGSVLMGGAIIDYLLGIAVNDYDIFYPYKPGQGFIVPITWKLTEADFNDPIWIKEHEEAYLQGVDENGFNPIATVYEYLVEGEHKVQLIGVHYEKAITHLKNFDHSLTLASYDSKGMFVHKKVFESKFKQTITYVSKNTDANAVLKSMLRAEKKLARLHNGADWELKGFVAAPMLVPQPDWGIAL